MARRVVAYGGVLVGKPMTEAVPEKCMGCSAITNVYRCSEEHKKIEYNSREDIMTKISDKNGYAKMSADYFEDLYMGLIQTARDAKAIEDTDDNIYSNLTYQYKNPITKISILARAVFNTELLILRAPIDRHEHEPNDGINDSR